MILQAVHMHPESRKGQSESGKEIAILVAIDR